MWNGAFTAPLWSGQATSAVTKSNQTLFLSNVKDDNPYIGITNGNSVQLPSDYQDLNVVLLSAGIINATTINTSYLLTTPAILITDTTLTAYGGNLYANGILVGGATSNSNVSQWANYEAINNINANGSNIFNVNNLSSISISTNTLFANSAQISSIRANVTTVSTISGLQATFSNFTFSSIKGNYANISTINNSTMYVNIGWFSTINVSSLNAPGFSNFLSNWSYYNALTDVNIANHNINNVVTLNTQGVYATSGITTNSLYVGTGGTTFSGDVRINGTGNTFSPYWYNFTMDANITTGQANQIYPPTNNQFFSDYHIGINVLDVESLPSAAFTLAHLDMASSGFIIPTGNVTLSANNYTLLVPYVYVDTTPPFIHTLIGSFRGNAYFGTIGSGQLAYVRMNYDASAVIGKIPNQGALLEINADSYIGVTANPLTTSSRIAITGGRNQSFSTYQNTLSAGDFGIWPVNTQICELDMYCPVGYLGGGTTTNRVQGGVFGSRNDMTAEGTLGGYGTEMNIYSTDLMYLYTNGDLYIGYGGEVPMYKPSGSEQPTTPYQHVHIAQVQDITGRTDNGDIGAQLVNINSVQAYTSNSFIKNFAYLVGYSENFAYPNEYMLVGISTVSTFVLTPVITSTITVFSSIDFLSTNSNGISTVYTSSIFPYLSTVSVSVTSISSLQFTSTVLEDLWNPSTINSNLSDWTINKFNYLKGISTILQDYQYYGSLVNVDSIVTSNVTTSNFVDLSNSEVDYAPIGTIPSIPTPSNDVTPLNLDFAISSINTYYQYSNVNLIDDYNVTLSSGNAFYFVDSNTCYGSGFSNQIISDFADNLILVADWSNSFGFFDVYNRGNIPITFQSEYPNEGVTVNPFTNSRMLFQGATADPPIDQQPITSNGLTPFYVSTLYENKTYFTQLVTGTTLEIDLSGTDVNNNPITGLGTFGINATLDLCNNNIQTVNQISVDNISTSTTGSTSFQNDIDMFDYNINNVNQLSTDIIQAAYSSEVQFHNQVDLGNNLLSGVSQINVDYIVPNDIDYVSFPSNGISTDFITGYTNSYIGFNNDANLLANNIIDVNQISVDYITPNQNSQIDFQGTNLSNINNLYMDGFFCSVPDTTDFEEVRFISYPDPDGGAPPFYFAYSSDNINYTPIAADWSAFPASQVVDANSNNISNVAILQFIHGSQISETLYNGSNSILLNAQTVTNGNFVIVNDSENPTLTFDSGKQGFIDFYENFRISCNVDMMSNDISNVNNLYAIDISAANINVSTINGVVPVNQIIQSGITTAGSTVTLPIAYSGTLSYGIQLTYTGLIDTTGYAPLASVINTVSEFIVWGNTGTSVFWTTIGV